MLTDDQVMAECIKVVNSSVVGLLTTVDFDGCPHARWMGSAIAEGGLRRVYTLTGKGSRKCEHLERNPLVSWTFSTPDYSDVVTLEGRAGVLSAPIVSQHVWDRLVACAKAYCMSVLSNDDTVEFVSIETQVERIEYLSPRLKLFKPRVIEMSSRVER